MTDLSIRPTDTDDITAIMALYPLAFPDEDLIPLIAALLNEPNGVLSLTALRDNQSVGHIAFTTGHVKNTPVALLGPLAITPTHQKQGIGTALMRTGFKHLSAQGLSRVCVLGDPAYYRRAGFRQENQIVPPYPLPLEWAEAWQGLSLSTSDQKIDGTLSLPTPWMQPELWGP